MTLDKIIVVTKKTAYEELLLEHATSSQARFYLESRGKDFNSYVASHRIYKSVVDETMKHLPSDYRKQLIERSLLPTHQFDDHDIVIVIGDPGLFVNAAKYVGKQPVISINGEPARFDDTFTTCAPAQINKKIDKVIENCAQIEALTMAQATLDDGQKLFGLNDLFIGRRTHVSAKYTLAQNNATEAQSSSGVIVSTGTGSTGWMKSVLTGAYAIADKKLAYETFGRDSHYLRFFVREPFPSKVTGCSMISGVIDERNPLQITSQMTEDGVIFSDGVDKDYITFNAGSNVVIKPAYNKVQLVR